VVPEEQVPADEVIVFEFVLPIGKVGMILKDGGGQFTGEAGADHPVEGGAAGFGYMAEIKDMGFPKHAAFLMF
jgi:hypothetical protein